MTESLDLETIKTALAAVEPGKWYGSTVLISNGPQWVMALVAEVERQNALIEHMIKQRDVLLVDCGASERRLKLLQRLKERHGQCVGCGSSVGCFAICELAKELNP